MTALFRSRFLRFRQVAAVVSVFILVFAGLALADVTVTPTDQPPKAHKMEKVEHSFGAGPFMVKGYQPLLEPRVSFVKRLPEYSEVVEYSWRPLLFKNLPRNERIDRIRCSFNRYYYSGHDKRFFYGAGIGGNIILINGDLEKTGRERGVELKDTVKGMVRAFAGYKLSQIRLFRTVYPIVLRVDGFASPDYKFGTELAKAGDRLKLTEITAGLSLSIE